MNVSKKQSAGKTRPRQILVIDVGGNNVKFLLTGQVNPRKFNSGPSMTPEEMAAGVRKAAKDWKYDVDSIGYLSRAQVEELEAASRLVKEPFDVTYADGTVRFDVDLSPHAIAAVTLELTPGPSVGGAAK